MLLNDLIDVLTVDIAVPNALGIDHADRPLVAAIQAAGLVDAHPAGSGQPQFLDPGLGMVAHVRGAATVAGRPLRVRPAIVDAEEQVALVIAHRL